MSKKEKVKKKVMIREGVVLKDKMQKTRSVEITRLTQHPVYGKTLRNKIRYNVHDEKNLSKQGDRVRISQSRPISKTKRWRVVEVLKK